MSKEFEKLMMEAMRKMAPMNIVQEKPKKKETKKMSMSAKDVDIVNQGSQIILPENMPMEEGIEWLQRKIQSEQTEVNVYHMIDTYPLDGAWAFARAVKKVFGFSTGVPAGWFNPGTVYISLKINATDTVSVPWGEVRIPGIDGVLAVKMDGRLNPPQFVLTGTVKKKHEKKVLELVNETREILKTDSIYRRKSIRVKFDYIHEGRQFDLTRDAPQFMDVSKVNCDELTFETQTNRIINTTLFAPIIHADKLREARFPLKRGILLSGKYGTGKTMTASVTAKYANDNGWTFIYLDDIRYLSLCLRLATQYSPCVVFAEDIDRVTSGERNTELDTILNTIDGIDSKSVEVITVLTTNHLERINPAMLRAGRLDAIIDIKLPDARAVMKLVGIYGGNLLTEDFDFEAVGKELAGQIPATIRECIERSKANAIMRTGATSLENTISTEDVLDSVSVIKAQIALAAPVIIDDSHPLERLGAALGKEAAAGFGKFLEEKAILSRWMSDLDKQAKIDAVNNGKGVKALPIGTERV